MDFLKAYEELTLLSEQTALALDSTRAQVVVKGKEYSFAAPFLPINEMLARLYKKRVSGIYVFMRKQIGNKRPAYYVGKAKDLYQRTKEHRDARPKDSTALHYAIKKYGINAFNIAIIEYYSPEELDYWEREWIAKLNTFLDTADYNLTPGGEGGASVYKVTLEMFEQIIEWLKDPAQTFTSIAKEFKIDRTNVARINDGSHWLTQTFIANFNGNFSGFPIRADDTKRSIVNKARKETQLLTCVLYRDDTVIGNFDSRELAFNHIEKLEGPFTTEFKEKKLTQFKKKKYLIVGKHKYTIEYTGRKST